MNRAGIKPQADSRLQSQLPDVPARSPQEMKQMVAHLESKLEALMQQREKLDRENHSIMTLVQDKMMEHEQQTNKNIDLEQRYIAIRSRDPLEIQREIQLIKNREIDMTSRIKSLSNLPMYKNDGGANTLLKLKESEDILIDLKGQLEVHSNKVKQLQAEVDDAKKNIEKQQQDRQANRKEISKAKALYEASVNRQNNGLLKLGALKAAQNQQESDMLMNDEFNEKFTRTLGLVRWRGEDPAWYKMQFLDKNQANNASDPESLQRELIRLNNQKRSLATKLEAIEGMLKATVDEEKKREDEQLIIKKQKENTLERLQDQRKELQSTLDRIGVGSGKLYAGKNQRTGEEIFYNDGVSVFSLDKSDLIKVPLDNNLLDLFIDRMDLNGEYVKVALSQINISELNPAALVTVPAVNFFNHPTLIGKKAFGLEAIIKMQCTFAFVCDGFFIEYCRANTLDVDIYYANEHNYQEKFAVARIELKDLIDANLKEKREDYIGVVNKAVRVHSLKGDQIGILSFRMKSRLPIYRDLVSYNAAHFAESEIPKSAFDSKHIGKERKLNIKICNGYGFSSTAEAFVAYRLLQFEEVTTQKVSGANPKFDHERSFTMLYSKGIRDFLRMNSLEVMVFDDSIPFNKQPPQIDAGGLRVPDYLGSGQ